MFWIFRTPGSWAKPSPGIKTKNQNKRCETNPPTLSTGSELCSAAFDADFMDRRIAGILACFQCSIQAAQQLDLSPSLATARFRLSSVLIVASMQLWAEAENH